MLRGTSANFELTLAISISIFALFITLMLSLYPPVIRQDRYWRKPLIGSIFTLICISGIIAIFYPKRCSESLSLPKIKAKESSNNKSGTSIILKGHHPDCEEFSPHIIQAKAKSFCAACTGLLLGALIAITGTMFYFFVEWNLGQNGSLLVWLGQIGIIFGLVQFQFKRYARLVVNAFFVVGTFLILAGIDMLAENLFIDLFLISLIIFWLFTRILISKWNNQRICFLCGRCEIKEG